MKKLLLILLSITLFSCSKASSTHRLRVVTFAMDNEYRYVSPNNVAMYLNHTTCICFPDSIYGYNTNPTFELDNVEEGTELHIVTFTNAGEQAQYKTIVVYLDGKVIYNSYNKLTIDAIVTIQ
jgi:hypothetical protein